MKKIFKRAMKPSQSFEEWANENNVQIPKKQPETVATVSTKKPLIQWLCTVSALIVIIAIVLPFALKDNTENPIIYSSQDATTELIEIDELYQHNNFLLFDSAQIVQIDRCNKDYPINNENLILSYSLTSCLIATTDEQNAFYIDYTIRIYHYYNFYTYQSYDDLTSSLMIGTTKINYKIQEESFNGNAAFISFIYNDLEYFIKALGFEDVTEVTETTLTILLTDLLNQTN